MSEASWILTEKFTFGMELMEVHGSRDFSLACIIEQVAIRFHGEVETSLSKDRLIKPLMYH